MPDYAMLAARADRKRQIAAYAPKVCRQYRKSAGISQSTLALQLGVSAPIISALENGNIRNWLVAEAVLILFNEDMELLKITETPGLRDRLARMLETGLPINVMVDDESAYAR